MKQSEDSKAGIETVRCDECHEYKIAMEIARQFRWPSPRTFGWTIGYDSKTKEILVSEAALMRIIQQMNPVQAFRRIRLVSLDELKEAQK